MRTLAWTGKSAKIIGHASYAPTQRRTANAAIGRETIIPALTDCQFQTQLTHYQERAAAENSTHLFLNAHFIWGATAWMSWSLPLELRS